MPLVDGTSVAINGKALLIEGASGSGKSSLALDMISRGAELIADDKIQAESRSDGTINLSAPSQIAGMIEARGIGVFRMEYCLSARLVAIVDMGAIETERIPNRKTVFMGVEFPLICGQDRPKLAASLCVMLGSIQIL